MADHQIDPLGGGFFGGHHEVAFVLPALVVGDDDDAAGRDGLDGGLNGVERSVGSHGERVIAFPAPGGLSNPALGRSSRPDFGLPSSGSKLSAPRSLLISTVRQISATLT